MLLSLNLTCLGQKAYAMDVSEEELPSEESIIATNSTPTNPPVIIDESDADDVSDVSEYEE